MKLQSMTFILIVCGFFSTYCANHEDPRILGDGGVFDSYYYMGFEAMKKMYGDRFVIPENLKQYEHISNGKVE